MQIKQPKIIVPIILSITGIVITFIILSNYSNRIVQEDAAFDAVTVLPGNVASDAVNLIYIMMPVYFIEFFLLTLPIAAIMLLVNRVAKSAWYMQSVVHMGEKFNTYRVLRRAVPPALFSISFSQTILGYVPDWLFVQPGLGFDRTVAYLYVSPLYSLNGALITLAVALAIYMPTWLLNDSGIVSHLKTEQLENRQCPDTHSVGKWYSNFISGFALFAYPLTMALQYFYKWITNPPLGFNQFTILVNSTIWSFGLPILVMTFVLPVVLLNEFLLSRFAPPVQSLARRLGAGEIYVKDLDDVMLDVSKTLADEVENDTY